MPTKCIHTLYLYVHVMYASIRILCFSECDALQEYSKISCPISSLPTQDNYIFSKVRLQSLLSSATLPIYIHVYVHLIAHRTQARGTLSLVSKDPTCCEVMSSAESTVTTATATSGTSPEEGLHLVCFTSFFVWSLMLTLVCVSALSLRVRRQAWTGTRSRGLAADQGWCLSTSEITKVCRRIPIQH